MELRLSGKPHGIGHGKGQRSFCDDGCRNAKRLCCGRLALRLCSAGGAVDIRVRLLQAAPDAVFCRQLPVGVNCPLIRVGILQSALPPKAADELIVKQTMLRCNFRRRPLCHA